MLNDFLILMRVELAITLLIFLLLFIRIGKGIGNSAVIAVACALTLAAIVLCTGLRNNGNLFAGMFVTTSMIVLQKSMLLLGTLLILLLNYDWLKKHEKLPEFLMLLFSALLGMCLMISSGNLLIFYLALELATIPVAAMANFDLDKKRSSEAAMKMILSSAFSSGVLLFGLSLIYGVSGTVAFVELPGHLNGVNMLEKTGFILFFAGVAFKLSVVPFHLWTADVYEGSPVAVTSFLSVVSKGAVAFIFITLLYKVFQPLGSVIYHLLEILSIATLIIGNLFALRQTNLKRFLAFSSIAQVGFILVGISAGSSIGQAAVTYFVLVYVFSNLAAFGVISVIGESTGAESLDQYRSLYTNNKLLSWIMAIALFSLAGIPPTAGFFGKLFLIMAGAGKGAVWFIAVVALNLVVSLYYYLRIVKAIFMDANSSPIPEIKIHPVPKWTLIVCGAAILIIGLIGWLYEHIKSLS